MKKTVINMLIFGVLSSCMVWGQSSNMSTEKQDFENDYKRIVAKKISLSREGSVRDLKDYEKFAEAINKKWNGKNQANYARLMSAVCESLNSGIFKDNRQYELARKYALLALEKPDDIPLSTELLLIGCGMMTNTIGSNIPTQEEFAKRRREDVAIRLHAWKRLINSIDPNYNMNEPIGSPNTVGADMGLPSGIAPEGVAEPLRAKYEAALEENRQKIEKRSEQSKLRKWRAKFSKRAEDYIVQLYSHPPFNTEELKKMLEGFPDPKAKAQMIKDIEKNIGASEK